LADITLTKEINNMLDRLLKENTGNIWDIAYNWIMMIFIIVPPLFVILAASATMAHLILHGWS